MIYSLNATVPVFALILLGYVFRRLGLINGEYVRTSNKLTFSVLLPIMLFNSMRGSDFYSVFDIKFVIVALLFMLIYPILVWRLSGLFIKDVKKQGSFVQGTFRGNNAVVGLGVAQNIYGMNLGVVPLVLGTTMFMNNIMSVVLLKFIVKGKDDKALNPIALINELIRIPLIWGVLLGLIFSLGRIPMPAIPDKILTQMGNAATVLSLIAAGGGFSVDSFKEDYKIITSAVFTKLIIMPLSAVSTGLLMGFRGSTLFAMFVMAGVSSATTCTVVAREMGCDEALATNILASTTLFASVTITAWVFALNSFGLL